MLQIWYYKKEIVYSNRLSSTKGGNREINQLYTTSQVSNITRKTTCLVDICFPRLNKKVLKQKMKNT